jgi:plasmid stabilization system protein ParE
LGSSHRSVVYRHDPGADTVTIMRIVHGCRDIKERLVTGRAYCAKNISVST